MRHFFFIPVIFLGFTGLLFAQRDGLSSPNDPQSPDTRITRVNSSGLVTPPVWMESVSVSFNGSELRKTLTQFANSQKLAFILDRRIDPSTEMFFSASGMKVENIFQEIAKSLNLGFVNLGQVAYFVPAGEEKRLLWIRQIIQEQLISHSKQIEATKRGGNSKNANFWQLTSLKTKKLDTPQEVLKKIAGVVGTRIENIDAVPHDLLDEIDLSNLNCSDAITIFLLGFDLMYTISPDLNSIRVVPIPENLAQLAVKASQKVDSSFQTAGELELGNKIERTDPRVESKTPTSAADASKQSQNTNTPLSKRRFTIEVREQTVIELLNTISKTLEMTLEISPKITQSALNKRISFELKNATFDKLMKTVLDPVNCKYKLSGKKIVISE